MRSGGLVQGRGPEGRGSPILGASDVDGLTVMVWLGETAGAATRTKTIEAVT